MGKMNFLNSEYVGKVGETYGVKQYGKYIEKAVPFSHAPFNEVQKNSRVAFERLNRVASVVAKNFWDYLPYKQGNHYKNNVVAHEWKNAIFSHTFFLHNLEMVIPPTGTLKLSNLFFYVTNRLAHFTLTSKLEEQNGNEERIFFGIFDDNMKCRYCDTFHGVKNECTVPIDIFDFENLYAMGFKSVPHGKTRLLTGYAQSPFYFVDN